MKAFRPLMWAALAGLPLLSAPAMAQGGTGHTNNNGMSATGSGAAVGSSGSMASPSTGVPQVQSPSQLPAAKGGTDGASAGESGGSGGGGSK